MYTLSRKVDEVNMIKLTNSKTGGGQLLTNAFTLVELLGVIIILGVIALITYPIIDKSIKNSKQQALDRTIDSIEEAAYKYSVENDIGYFTEYKTLQLSDLVSKGFLRENITNPVTNEQMQGCVLYRWDDTNNQYIFEYSEECEVPLFPGSLINILLTQYQEGNTTGLVKDSTNPNLYYYTGTNEQVANNFLWYGGHQWRVLEFDESANTLTLITQQPLTSISPASAVWESEEAYNNSYINNWLNDYFLNSLDSSIQANIQDSTFNIGIYTDVDEITTIKKVGLLDEDQYKRAGDGTTGQNSFLDIKDHFWLGNRSSSSGVRNVDNNGTLDGTFMPVSHGVRAVIKISDITITGGDGTLASNYQVTNKSTNTDNVQVGEYINVPYSGSDNACGSDNMCTFRVVSKDEDSIKVVLNGLLPTESEYGSSATISTSHTIYTLLNTFAEGISNTYRYTGNKTFYIGDYPYNFPIGTNYKNVQDETLEASIGLPTVGEMFSGNDIDLSTSSTKKFVDINTIENPTVSIYYWLMNRKSSSDVKSVYLEGYLNGNSVSRTDGVRAVIYLKSGLAALDFTGGEGTPNSPYTLQ